jgi:hypothetical protein
MTIANAIDNIKLIKNYLQTESIAYVSDLQIYNYYEMERLTGLRSWEVLDILLYLFN